MKVTVTFEEEQDWEGKAWSLSFTKDVDNLEDYLYAVGRSGSFMFDGLCELEGKTQFFDQNGNTVVKSNYAVF